MHKKVCVYNRLRVDGALVSNLEATASKAEGSARWPKIQTTKPCQRPNNICCYLFGTVPAFRVLRS